MRDSFLVLWIGLPIGFLLSIATAVLLRGVLSEVEPYAWSVLFLATGVLGGCVVVAAYAAARRSADADPIAHMNAG